MKSSLLVWRMIVITTNALYKHTSINNNDNYVTVVVLHCPARPCSVNKGMAAVLTARVDLSWMSTRLPGQPILCFAFWWQGMISMPARLGTRTDNNLRSSPSPAGQSFIDLTFLFECQSSYWGQLARSELTEEGGCGRSLRGGEGESDVSLKVSWGWAYGNQF